VYHCAQLSYTTAQSRAVLIIFSLISQTSTRAKTLSIGGEGGDIGPELRKVNVNVKDGI